MQLLDIVVSPGTFCSHVVVSVMPADLPDVRKSASFPCLA